MLFWNAEIEAQFVNIKHK